MQQKNRRRRKLILPRLQLGMLTSFFAVAALVLMFQFLMVMRIVTQVAEALPTEADVFRAEVNGSLTKVGLLSFALLAPLAGLFGVASTFRVAGPVYRMKTWARSVLAGEESEECRLRHGDEDELHELCDLVNRVAEPMLARNRAEHGGEPADEDAVPESRAA